MICAMMERHRQSFPSQDPTYSSHREPSFNHASSCPYPPPPAMDYQGAYPVRTQTTYPANSTCQPYPASNLQENTLRRKVPGGTINGGYTSDPHETQAAKHMLMPRDEIPSAYGPFPQLDSVLSQTPYRQLHHHQYYGQTVPSVNQPSFQYTGPTASGVDGRGPYGPYWNDGTYVPYRPNALRDPRFYRSFRSDERWGPGISYGRLVDRQPEDSTPGAYTPTSLRTGSWPTLRHGGLALPHPYASPETVGSLKGSKRILGDDQLPGHASTSVQYREQTFHWALQIYRDLLLYIQHVRKQKQPAASQTQPSFYPRPPKLSGAPFPSPSNQDLDPKSDGRSRRSSEHAIPISHGRPHHEPQTDKPMQPPSVYHSAPCDLEHSSATVSTTLMSPHQDNPPPSRAIIALATVSELCQEAGWQWIDGMHLGGCLAYGLGDYAKAQRWYNKVLELDPRHLEAKSNLAATLLLLGQKEEAEVHWRQVIKDAPNHFEAVEHLVGLLCQNHRAKDAVKIIDYVQNSLRLSSRQQDLWTTNSTPNAHSNRARKLSCPSGASEQVHGHDAEQGYFVRQPVDTSEPGFGSSGYAIPGPDNGRILSLIHAKGNMLYAMGDNLGAAKTFEDAVLLAVGRHFGSIPDLVRHVISMITTRSADSPPLQAQVLDDAAPVLLYPDQAAQTARLCFPHHGDLAGLRYVPGHPKTVAKAAAVATTSNSLLSLAKIFQDNISVASKEPEKRMLGGVKDILAIYYLSLSLQPSPSTANNIGILLAGVQQSVPMTRSMAQHRHSAHNIPGVAPGSGIALALAYYNYGLLLDSRHAHLYTNLGSLLKDIGQLDAAIKMYKSAVQCDAKFDIALANLANAVKDKGRISDAIEYYKRAVDVNPDFAEAVCGLTNALNSVCRWQGRGGIIDDAGAKKDRWHVNTSGMLLDGSLSDTVSSGWIKRVLDIVEKQLGEGETWGIGVLTPPVMDAMVQCLTRLAERRDDVAPEDSLRQTLRSWAGKKGEGARIVRLVDRATKRITWRWYQDNHVDKKPRTTSTYVRPRLPAALPIPHAPTVLPFHTFTAPLSAKQIRLISQRNGYRISASTMRMPWLPTTVYPPPAPPRPFLRVGYVSSDFNNHPLAHLMQSVFGLHDPSRVQAICYATTPSDNSVHRRQIESEAPVFHDVSSWSSGRIVKQIVDDGCHILVNLNGYTRGARNDVFAARPAPIQMSFMGFAGTLGAEWCDYLLADEMAVPPSALRPWRRNVDLEDVIVDGNDGPVENEGDEWVYGENLIYCRDTFFCCDHKQSAPDSHERRLTWDEEQTSRWRMRKELFPTLPDDAVIFANFNQLYKIDPTTFRTWLRILSAVPSSVLWLLRFPDLGESNLLSTATLWAGPAVASRIIFTDVAPKHLHIARAKAADLFLDTPECNAHTTAADCLWSGTPLLTLPRWEYKMCSRMAASILLGALPTDPDIRAAATKDLIAGSEEEYEELAVRLGRGLRYPKAGQNVGRGEGRLVELRRMLVGSRWTSGLFDTARWVRDLEDAMEEVWERWVRGEGGDVWLKDVPVGGRKAKVTSGDR